MASVQENWESELPGTSNWKPTVNIQGRMYHRMGGLIPPDGLSPRYASLYIYDIENSATNRSRFFANIDENVMVKLEKMLLEKNKSKEIPEDLDLIIHTQKQNPTDYDRKYNPPEGSEVALTATNENCGPIDVSLTRKGTLDKNGYEKLMNIHLIHRIYVPRSVSDLTSIWRRWLAHKTQRQESIPVCVLRAVRIPTNKFP